jgi:hypothetical protein
MSNMGISLSFSFVRMHKSSAKKWCYRVVMVHSVPYVWLEQRLATVVGQPNRTTDHMTTRT